MRLLTEWRPKPPKHSHRRRLPYEARETPNLAGYVGSKSVEELREILTARKSRGLELTDEMIETYGSVSQGLSDSEIKAIWKSL